VFSNRAVYLLKKIIYLLLLSIFILLAKNSLAYSQGIEDQEIDNSVRVFLDRFWRWESYIKDEIPYVDYVRDPKQANLYILLTRERTGGGGREYTLTFIGQENFSGKNDTLKYISSRDDTEEIERRGLIKYLEMGLVGYVSKTPLADIISIEHKETELDTTPISIKDKWNFWVFRINTRMDIEEEESYRESSIGGSVSANRVTKDWKVNLRFSSDYDESRDETSEGTYNTFQRSTNFNGLIVKSIDDHWSAGFTNSINSNTRINTKYSIELGPAVEYNIFPYSLYTRRQFTFRLGFHSKTVNYFEETIFNKTSNQLYFTSLMISTQIIERWGNIFMSLDGNVYFHDPDVNKIDLDTNFDIRLFKGFSLDVGFEVSLIHDQLYLSKGDIPIEEVLLRRTQLKTNWRYETNIGFSYYFGSQFNNIINPRFTGIRRHYRF